MLLTTQSDDYSFDAGNRRLAELTLLGGAIGAGDFCINTGIMFCIKCVNALDW